MYTFDGVRSALSRRRPEIIAAFTAATDQEPWDRLPTHERINYLANLIIPFTNFALLPRSDRDSCRRTLHIAARHGERRSEQGFSDETLFQDLYHFRSAICSQLKNLDSSEVFTEAVLRIDKLVSLASLAALRGYYRSDYEARGEWPDVIDEISESSEAVFSEESESRLEELSELELTT